MVSASTPTAMPPPPTPLKRPNLGAKRSSSHLASTDDTALSTATKKLKVQFSPDVDIRYMEADDWDDKSYDLVKEEVNLGIARHIAPTDQKDEGLYTRLLSTLGEGDPPGEVPSSALLAKYVKAIDNRVSGLGECSSLVIALLDVAWIGRNDSFIALYTRFLCDLLSAHPKFTPAVMERLVSKFAKLPASHGRLPGEQPVSRACMFSRVHAVLQTIIRALPSSSGAVLRMLKQEFPNDSALAKTVHQYQTQLLRFATNVPELKPEVLALLVQKLVSLDVQIQHDVEDLEG